MNDLLHLLLYTPDNIHYFIYYISELALDKQFYIEIWFVFVFSPITNHGSEFLSNTKLSSFMFVIPALIQYNTLYTIIKPSGYRKLIIIIISTSAHNYIQET